MDAMMGGRWTCLQVERIRRLQDLDDNQQATAVFDRLTLSGVDFGVPFETGQKLSENHILCKV